MKTISTRIKLSLLMFLSCFILACSDEELESRVANLESLVSVSVSQQIETIKNSITSLENANKLVNEHISVLDGDVKDLKSNNEKFGKDIEALRKLIDDNSKDLKTWVEGAYATLSMYESISNDIKDVKASLLSLTGRVDSLDELTAALVSSLDKCNKEVDSIKKGLEEVAGDVDALKEQMAQIVEAIQSIIVIPDYSDGSVHMTGLESNELKFEIYPLNTAKQVAALGVTALSLDYVKTQTKASSEFTTIPLTSVSFDEKVLSVIANGSGLPDAILCGEQSVNARLKVSTGTVTKTSEFFALSFDVQRCVTLDAQAISPVSATLSGYSSKSIQNPSMSCGFEYSLSQESITTTSVEATVSDEPHSFTAEVKQLQPNKTYYYRAFVQDGTQRHYGEIKQFATSDFEYVDLGLSVKWATCNLGANTPYEDGDYYAWGELTTKESYTNANYDYANLESLTELPAERDVASVIMGGSWRMPSQSELHELIENCNITFVEEYDGHQVLGYKVESKINGKTVFLPTSGFKNETGLVYYNQYEFVRSSLSSTSLVLNYGFRNASFNNPFGRPRPNNYFGVTIRPVLGDRKPPLESIQLESQTIKPTDSNITVFATLNPENASVDCLIWSIDDRSIASISDPNGYEDFDGLYSSVRLVPGATGVTTLRAHSIDNSISASCTITVEAPSIESSDMVDMGLSVKWATCNLGASKAEESGLACVWGGLEFAHGSNNPSDFNKWMGDDGKLLGYCYDSSYGVVDNRGVLLPEDDIAAVNLGDKWRIPTKKEWQELLSNSSFKYYKDYENSGCSGWLFKSTVPGHESSSIFLPQSGYSGYWSSNVAEDNPLSYAFGRYFYSWGDYRDGVHTVSRRALYSIRPVYGDRNPSVTGIVIDKTSITVNKGTFLPPINATVLPENAASDVVGWRIMDESIVARTDDNKMIALGEGKTTITAVTVDGGFSATCEVTVTPSDYSYEYVDLGNGMKWATCNLGATSPEESGYYFAWGETEPKEQYELTNYKWYTDDDNDGVWEWVKYNTPNAELLPEDDAATVHLGDNWRIPTVDDWHKIIDRCFWEKVSNYNGSGVDGILLTSFINGNSIFIPNTTVIGPLFQDYEYCPLLWSNKSGSEGYAWCYPGQYARDQWLDVLVSVLKSYGLPIRPVYVGE